VDGSVVIGSAVTTPGRNDSLLLRLDPPPDRVLAASENTDTLSMAYVAGNATYVSHVALHFREAEEPNLAERIANEALEGFVFLPAHRGYAPLSLGTVSYTHLRAHET